VGTTTITATSGSESVTITVTVQPYTDMEVVEGNKVYGGNGCGPCHAGADQPDITSSGLGKHTDGQLAGAFTMGINPDGNQIPISHSFPVMGVDISALVAYLRMLPPKQIPVQDD
jgi:hypothetical protein